MNKITLLLVICLAAMLTACDSPLTDEATVASHNNRKDADNFKILRKITFINGITDTELLQLEGYCSISPQPSQRQLEVLCKQGANTTKKHFLGYSDNTTYVVEQLEALYSDPYHFKLVIRPRAMLPNTNIEVR